MTIQKRSFISGLLYVSLAIIGPFAFLLIPSQFVVEGSLNAYAISHTSTIILWLFLDSIIIVIEVVLTIYLWKLFNEYNERLSLIAFILRMIMISVMVINVGFLFLLVIDGGATAETFIPYHNKGVYIWQIIFSGHVFILGYMVTTYVTSNWKYLGYIVILGSIGYFIDSLNNLLSLTNPFITTFGSILLVFVTVGEIGMAVGLLMKKLILPKK